MEKFKYWSGKRDGTILSFEKDMEYGFSWPQRNYTCNFCTKEFKSGQALGGHMNMHRKDRAKMSLAAWPHATTMFRRINTGTWGHCMKSTSPFSTSPRKEKVPGIEHLWSYKKNKAMIKNEPITLTRRKDTSTDWKGNDLIRFDLVQEPNDDLDLELRLG